MPFRHFKYTFTEIAAPNGYNKLEEPVTVTISFTAPSKAKDGTEKCEWKADGDSVFDSENGIVTVTIENNAGSTLPSTGGIGTTMFYIIGTIMVIGAGVVLISRRRMNVQ
ncbi:MAG: LPXTG cell wall anchor domain-containing protein [Lachnospiraceae bacterium]|nr:LPXTG cell wall anchor domain-containing protein [Lachnospiraceae bacterium]